MTKMAVMPIYGSSSPGPKGRWPWNLVCSIGCTSTSKFIQIMSLDWSWPILRQGQIYSIMLSYGKKVKQWIFHVELPWVGRTKVYSNGPGHVTKMVAMFIYGKNLKKSSSPEPKGRCPWILICSIGCISTTKFIQMMTLGWLWLILRQGQICSLMLSYGKKVNQWMFLETIVVYDIKVGRCS